MHSSVFRAAGPCLIILLAAAAPPAGQTLARAPQAGEPTVVFAVKKNQSGGPEPGDAMLDPVVVIEGGRFTAPPEGLSGGDAAAAAAAAREKRFIRDFYRPARQYRLLFGGGEAGSASVLKYIEPGCVGLEASARLQTTARLGGEVDALATNSKTLGRGAGVRRAPTPEERAAAVKLAERLLEQKGAAAAAVAKMQTQNLTAVELGGDDRAELVGAFIIMGEFGVEHAAFMIFEAQAGGGLRPALAWHHRGQEADSAYRRLVDVLDLDGDGAPEVVAQGIYYESHDYMIYKKERGGWRVAYQGGGGGC